MAVPQNKYKNNATVLGIPKSVILEEPPGKKSYLSLEVMCPSKDGSLIAYGKMRGDENEIKSLEAFVKSNPGSPIKLRGVITQFKSNEEEGKLLTNYTFFRWEPAVLAEFKAVFVVRGELLRKNTSNGDGILTISQLQQGSEQPDELVLYTSDLKEMNEFKEGTFIELKGRLKAKTPEDEYCEATSSIKPYAERISSVELS